MIDDERKRLAYAGRESTQENVIAGVKFESIEQLCAAYECLAERAASYLRASRAHKQHAMGDEYVAYADLRSLLLRIGKDVP